MAVAQIYPEPEKGGRGQNAVIVTDFASNGYISHARTVLRFTPEAVPVIMSGAISLDAAYQEAKAVKDRSETEEARRELVSMR